jgi:hypothetical protein
MSLGILTTPVCVLLSLSHLFISSTHGSIKSHQLYAIYIMVPSGLFLELLLAPLSVTLTTLFPRQGY